MEYEKESIHTTDAPAPAGAYSQGMAWRELVFTAGQAAIDPESGALIEGDVAHRHARPSQTSRRCSERPVRTWLMS